MPLQITCPYCQTKQLVPDDIGGHGVVCAACQKILKIAAPAAPVAKLVAAVAPVAPLARPVAAATIAPAVHAGPRKPKTPWALYIVSAAVISTMAVGISLAVYFFRPGREPSPSPHAKGDPPKAKKDGDKSTAAKKPSVDPPEPDLMDDGADDLFEDCVVTRAMGEPYRDGQQTKVRLEFTCVDPQKLIKEIKVVVWTGDIGAPKAASSRPPRVRAGDSPREEIAVPLKQNRGAVDVLLPTLPKDKMYWLQPVLVHASGKMQWLAVEPWEPIAPPLERQSATLKHQFAAAERKVQLSSLATVPLAEEGSKPYKFKVDLTADLDETFSSPPLEGGARGGDAVLRVKYRRIQFEFARNGIPFLITERCDPALTAMSKLAASWRVDSTGTLSKPTVKLDSLDEDLRDDITEFHNRLALAMELANLEFPNRELSPLASWTFKRLWNKATVDVTATYEGRRINQNRDEAFVTIRGTIKSPGAGKTGQLEGTASIDLKNGFVMRADLKAETALTVPFIGADNLSAMGVLEVRMTREAAK
jgi:hypothetical protein